MGRKERAATYADYEIDPERKKELQYFCRQYPKMKSLISYGISRGNLDGMPRGYGIADPTAHQAIKNAARQTRCKIIEKAAQRTTQGQPPEVYNALMQNVTQGTAFIYLTAPVSDADFYALRRLFYAILDEALTDAFSQIRTA